MASVFPFRALRPPIEKAARVAAVPYDVINSDEARELAAGNPISLLHVTRPEIDLPAGTDLHADEVYAKAAENLDRLITDVPFLEDAEPRYYIYRLVMGEREQTGIVGCCAVDEYDTDVIRKHERTRKDKEDDRTRHVVTLRAHAEPVFLAYRGHASLDDLVARHCRETPLYDFTAPDGIRHTVWSVADTAPIEEAFRAVPLLYVADGHHRSASASRARAHMRERNPDHTGNEAYNRFLAVLFPAEQLRILPYNRIVSDLNGHTPESLLAALAERMTVTDNAAPVPDARGSFAMYLAGKWHGLRIPPDSIDRNDPIGSLDVSLLQDRVLAPLLGVADVRTDKRIDFVGGIRGTAELEKLVDSGTAAVAFSMYPTSLDDLMAVSDAGEIMPPKSTWFEPKLRSGLFIHRF